MLSTDRAEFDAQLITLCAGYNIPVGERSSAYWLGLQKMELVTFARVVIECLGPDGPEKFPTVGVCWQIAKKLRAMRYPPRAAEPKKPQWQGNQWDEDANFNLRIHLRNHPHKYAPDVTYDHVKHEVVAGPLTRAYTAILVRWKKTWAEDMRAETNPSGETKRESWEECMGRADEEIRAIPQQAAA